MGADKRLAAQKGREREKKKKREKAKPGVDNGVARGRVGGRGGEENEAGRRKKTGQLPRSAAKGPLLNQGADYRSL